MIIFIEFSTGLVDKMYVNRCLQRIKQKKHTQSGHKLQKLAV